MTSRILLLGSVCALGEHPDLHGLRHAQSLADPRAGLSAKPHVGHGQGREGVGCWGEQSKPDGHRGMGH